MKVFKNEKAKGKIFETYDKLLKLWDVPLKEKDINTKYGRTHIIELGSSTNPPLLLFHGVGDTSALMWIYNAKELSKHFHIYAIDTIGGPGKSCPNENYNKSFRLMEWIDDIIANLNLDKVYMAGVSNGAYMTHSYGIKRPERVIKMVCMAGGVSTEGGSHPLKTMIKVFMPEGLFPTKSNIVKLLKKMSGDHSEVFTDNPVILDHFTYLLKGFNRVAMANHKIEFFTNEQIKNLQGKCLFLCGGSDPLGDADRACEKFKKFHLDYQIYDHVGHGINHEIPKEINQRIIDYLKN